MVVPASKGWFITSIVKWLQQKKQALFFFVCLFLVAVDVGVDVLRW